MSAKLTELEIRKAIKERYGKLAQSGSIECGTSCCSTSDVIAPESLYEEVETKIAKKITGYTNDQLESLPEEVSNISAGCGNPTALAELKEGDVVLDLGSGGGIDVFLAAQKLGANGLAIGVDATPEMIWRAREVAEKQGYKNVEFRLGEIEHLPVENESIDVIISNCVINLSPNKDQVFKEAYRVLKPNGKMVISDIVTLGELPEDIKNNLEQWSGCIAGAIGENEYLQKMKNAGFAKASVTQRHIFNAEEVKSMLGSCIIQADHKLIEKYASKVASSKFVAYKFD